MIGNTSSDRNWEVFIGEDIRNNTNSRVIIKTLVTTTNANIVTKTNLFRIEAEILLKAQHHGIPKLKKGVEILELEFAENIKAKLNFNEEILEIPCLVMEYIKGENLRKWLQRANKLEDEKLAWKWLKEIVLILDHVHNLNYFHRDIKPDNIMLMEGLNKLVVIDFGIAKHSESNIQSANTVIGTPGYKAPEIDMREGDHRSDFYSLGRTFYHLTTGSSPEDPEFRENWENQTNFKNSTIISMINWMVKGQPSERPQTTTEILYAIDILSKPKSDRRPHTQEDANNLIDNILNLTLEGNILRWQLQEKNTQIQEKEQQVLDRDTSIELINKKLQEKNTQIQEKEQQVLDRDISIDRINNQLSRTRKTLANRHKSLKNRNKQLRNIIVNFKKSLLVGGLIVLTLVASSLNFYLRERVLITQNEHLAAQIKRTNLSLASIPSTEFFISSGDYYKKLFKTDLGGDNEELLKKACEKFKSGNYESAFNDFQSLYGVNRNDPQLPIYMNNSKIKYLLSEKKIKSEEILKIAVPVPATLETGQHILEGVALKQQLLLNPGLKSHDPMENNINSIGSTKKPAFYIEVVIADEDTPKHAKELAQKLIKEHSDILSVVGHYSTEAMAASLKVYADTPIAAISPTASVYGLNNAYPKEKNVFFRTISSTIVEAHSWIKFLKSSYVSKSDLNNIVVFYQADKTNITFSQSMFSQFKYWADKEKIILEEKHIFSNLFNAKESELDEFIKRVPPNSIIVIIPKGKKNEEDPDFAKTIYTLNTLNIERVKYIIGSNPLFSAADVPATTLGKWKDKLIIGVDWDAECSGTTSFRDNLAKFVNGDLDRRTASSFEDVQVLSYLFKKIKAKNSLPNYQVTRADIINELRSLGSEEIVSEVFKDGRHISFVQDADIKNNINIGDRKESIDRILVKPDVVYVKNNEGKDVPKLKKFTSFTGSSCKLPTDPNTVKSPS